MRGVLAGLAVATALTASAAHAAYEEIAVRDGGTLSGVVRFAGTPPKLDPLPVHRNREVCGEQKPSEALVVGPDRGVRGSVVLIEGVTKGRKPAGEVLLDNHRCLFVAHVSALAVGDKARVKNSDEILHHTHGFMGRSTVFNLALPQRDQTIDITRRLTRPGVVRVVCDAHPHMGAWLVVHDSPYVAVTDDRGAFRIADVPPGRYRVAVWHEGFRPRGVDRDGYTITKDVTIAPKGASTVEFELK